NVSSYASKVCSRLLCRLLSVLCVCVGIANMTYAGSSSDRDPCKRKVPVAEEVRNARNVKAAMVSTLELGVTHPELIGTPELNELRESAGDLVTVFDPMTSLESLKILISLEPYYFGEGPHEVLDCVLSQKGKELLPVLTAGRSNDCSRRFGKMIHK